MRSLRLASLLAVFLLPVLIGAGCRAPALRPSAAPASLTTPAPAPLPAQWRCLFQGQDGLYSLGVASGQMPELVQVLPREAEIEACAVSPDYARLAIAVVDGPCLIKDLRSGETTTLIQESEEPGELAWSPDGTSLAFGKSGQLWAYRKGKQARLCEQTRVTHLAWSPDGTRIAFACRDNDEQDRGLWLIAAAGGEARRLAPPSGEVYSPDHLCWSPDGRWLAFGHAWEGAVLGFARADGRRHRFQVDTISWPLVWKQDGSAVLYQAMVDEMTSRGVRSCTPEGQPKPVLKGAASSSYDILPGGEILVVNNPGEGKGPRQVQVQVVPGKGQRQPGTLSMTLEADSAEGSLAPDGAAWAVLTESGETRTLFVAPTGSSLTPRGAGKRLLGWLR